MGKGAAYPPTHAHRAGTPLPARPWPPACLVWFKGTCLSTHHLKMGGEVGPGEARQGHSLRSSWARPRTSRGGSGMRLSLMGRVADLQDRKLWRSASQQPEDTRSHGPAHSETLPVIHTFF